MEQPVMNAVSEGGIMSVKKTPPSLVPEDELDPVIARYESMSAEEVADELRQFGISPQPTIDAVTALGEAKLAEWRDRGLLHPKEAIVLFALAVISAMRCQLCQSARPWKIGRAAWQEGIQAPVCVATRKS